MTATDELRRMLDERGVEHLDGIIMTYTDDADYMPSASNTFDVTLYNLTPEQAIDATLWRGTCHNVALEGEWFECSTCGCVRQLLHPHFCPNCGRKVVDE